MKTKHIFTMISIILLMSACSQNRKNAQIELNIVERIGEEISLYRFYLEYGKAHMTEVILSGETLLDAIRNPGIHLSDEEIETHLNKLGWLWLSSTPTNEYVALINTGEMTLISSEELRRKFKRLVVDQERLKQFEEIQVDYVNRELRPFLNRHTDRTTLDMHFKSGSLITNRYPSQFEYTPGEILKSMEFGNILTDVLFFTRRIMLPYHRIEIVMNEMEEIIARDYPEANYEAFVPF